MKHFKIKVAFVSHSTQIAGAERSFVNFISHLSPNINAIAILPQEDGPIENEITSIGIPVFKIKYNFSFPPHGKRQLKIFEKKTYDEARQFSCLFRELEVDLVVVNTNVIYPAIYAAVHLEIPVILHSHGMVNQQIINSLNMKIWPLEDNSQLLSATKIVCPSHITANMFLNFYKIPNKMIEMIFNGTTCEDDWFPLPVTPSMNPKKFVMLCTIEPNKNIQLFIEAAEILKQWKINNLEFHIYGNGRKDFLNKLKIRIQDKNLNDSFFFHEKTTNVNKIYDSATGVCVASQSESFSFVIIEAMSRGRPVISTRCGGPESIIEDGKTGFLIDRNDAFALAKKIQLLAMNLDLARTMGVAGRNVVESKYNIIHLAAQYSQYIQSVVETTTSNELRSKHMMANQYLQLKNSILLEKSSLKETFPSLVAQGSSYYKQYGAKLTLKKIINKLF